MFPLLTLTCAFIFCTLKTQYDKFNQGSVFLQEITGVSGTEMHEDVLSH